MIFRVSDKPTLLCYIVNTQEWYFSIIVFFICRSWSCLLYTSPEQVEFDVMAESLDKKYLLVGECKWTTQENGKQLTAELLLFEALKTLSSLPISAQTIAI